MRHKLLEHELDNFREQFNQLYTKSVAELCVCSFSFVPRPTSARVTRLANEDEDGDKLVVCA